MSKLLFIAVFFGLFLFGCSSFLNPTHKGMTVSPDVLVGKTNYHTTDYDLVHKELKQDMRQDVKQAMGDVIAQQKLTQARDVNIVSFSPSEIFGLLGLILIVIVMMFSFMLWVVRWASRKIPSEASEKTNQLQQKQINDLQKKLWSNYTENEE